MLRGPKRQLKELQRHLGRPQKQLGGRWEALGRMDGQTEGRNGQTDLYRDEPKDTPP